LLPAHCDTGSWLFGEVNGERIEGKGQVPAGPRPGQRPDRAAPPRTSRGRRPGPPGGGPGGLGNGGAAADPAGGLVSSDSAGPAVGFCLPWSLVRQPAAQPLPGRVPRRGPAARSEGRGDGVADSGAVGRGRNPVPHTVRTLTPRPLAAELPCPPRDARCVLHGPSALAVTALAPVTCAAPSGALGGPLIRARSPRNVTARSCAE